MFLNTKDLFDDEIFLKLERTAEADPARKRVPAYYFKICRLMDDVEMGICDLRIGHEIGLYYGGNIGYTVYEPFRGHYYAGKACKLLFKQARKHDLGYLYITCNPNNLASRKSCEFAGAVLEDIVDLPEDNDMYQDGERQKCIYRFALD